MRNLYVIVDKCGKVQIPEIVRRITNVKVNCILSCEIAGKNTIILRKIKQSGTGITKPEDLPESFNEEERNILCEYLVSRLRKEEQKTHS